MDTDHTVDDVEASVDNTVDDVGEEGESAVLDGGDDGASFPSPNHPPLNTMLHPH